MLLSRVRGIAVTIVVLFVATPDPAFAQSPRELVDAGLAAIAEGVANRDAVAIAAVYGSDAIVTQPGDEIHTRAGIQRMWQSMLDRGVSTFEVEVSDVDLEDNAITEIGSWSMRAADGTVLSTGVHRNVWRQEGGTWRIMRTELKLASPPA